MPRLFSYGTLQQDDVQLATFGRTLHGQRDELPGFTTARVPITDPATVAALGRTHHDNVVRAGSDSHVAGTVFDITDDELARADEYEARYDYVRIKATLASGIAAWVYVDSSSHLPPPT
jgi:gamma-glutamylcyclotransferase (GGCT)/AIG2-like uncharacterized protein YtfP